MKRKKILSLLLALLLGVISLSTVAAAHPQALTVEGQIPDGWLYHYTDGHTSAGYYFNIINTGELLFCIEPHVNKVGGERTEWKTLAQYFGNDTAFADRLSLIAYYGMNSGWGLDGYAAAQSLIWKYVMERNGESGEQYITTPNIPTRTALQNYYDSIESKVKSYLSYPSFSGQTITLEAGESISVTDSSGVISAMDIVSISGPIQISQNGNTINITATGISAGKGEIRLKKPLPNGIEGQNFAYISDSLQDIMTWGCYDPLYANLSIDITQATTSMLFSKQDLTTGNEIPGAQLKVTDASGNTVDSWISGTKSHMISGLVVGQTYTMTEMIPAPGYAAAQNIIFTAEKDAEPVIMKDDITRFEISKTDITTGEELPGARLQVTDKNGTVIDEWISEKTPHSIKKLTVGETYILTEKIPAPGYVTAESIEFTVSDTAEIQKIVMEDAPTETEVSKLDTDNKTAISGAVLQIIDKDNNVIEEWTSEIEPKRIKKLVVGENYVLHEKNAPEGYLTASDVEFTVEDTEEIQTIVMEDKRADIKLEVGKETICQTKAGDTYKYTITDMTNASNTELDNFICTDFLPEQVILQELRTGTFSCSLPYSISFQTNLSDEWNTLAGGLDSTENKSLSFKDISLRYGEQITAFRYEFKTVPEGFCIQEEPEYYVTVKADIKAGEELINDIKLTGDWKGETFEDRDQTITTSLESPAAEVITGDMNRMIPWAVLLSVSGIGLTGMAIYRKKKKTDK